jgi:hypothetical protein
MFAIYALSSMACDVWQVKAFQRHVVIWIGGMSVRHDRRMMFSIRAQSTVLTSGFIR